MDLTGGHGVGRIVFQKVSQTKLDSFAIATIKTVFSGPPYSILQI